MGLHRYNNSVYGPGIIPEITRSFPTSSFTNLIASQTVSSLPFVEPRFSNSLISRVLSITALLTCGNPSSMEDIKRVADRAGFRFEKEDWKLVLPSKT